MPDGSGGRTLANKFEINASLAALSASGKDKMADRLYARIDRIDEGPPIGEIQVLELSRKETQEIFRALLKARDNRFYGQQNELMNQAMLRRFEADMPREPSKIERLKRILGRINGRD